MGTAAAKTMMILGAVLHLVPLMHCMRVYPEIKTLLIKIATAGGGGLVLPQGRRKNLLAAWALTSDELLASSAAAG